MDLLRIQHELEGRYEIQTSHSVTDFLVTDPAVARALDNADGSCDPAIELPPEQLLLLEEPDAVNLTLFIDADVLERLATDDPYAHLHSGNMSDLCLVLEGISHFLYVVWSATHDRSLTQLELELQAEIDKYVSLANLYLNQQHGPLPKALHQWLFERIRFHANLDTGTLNRYRDANRFAGRYCRHLEQTYFRHREHKDPSSELKRFYRLSRGDKIHRIRAV